MAPARLQRSFPAVYHWAAEHFCSDISLRSDLADSCTSYSMIFFLQFSSPQLACWWRVELVDAPNRSDAQRAFHVGFPLAALRLVSLGLPEGRTGANTRNAVREIQDFDAFRSAAFGSLCEPEWGLACWSVR